MANEPPSRRVTLDEKMMNLVSLLFDMAIGLYRRDGNNHEAIQLTSEAWGRFEPFCQAVRSDPVRCAACDADHLARARAAEHAGLRVCHAGLVNFCLPILNERGVQATLIGGELRLIDDDIQRQSRAHFEQFAARFRLSPAEAERLWAMQQQARPITQAAFQQDMLPKLERIVDLFAEYLRAAEEHTRESEAIAHNFSTQVRVVLLNVNQLNRVIREAPNLKRDIKNAATEVYNAVTVLSDIVMGYLASYEDSTVRFKSERIDLLVRRAAATYHAEAEDRTVEIRVMLEPTEPPFEIECSREHLLVALRNLVHNAIKYSYAGDTSQGRRRYVMITGSPRAGGYELTVENYGVGIDPDEYQLIFERGYQGRHTQREYRSGAGRGLPLAKHYIEHIHRGTLKVRSECVGSVSPEDNRPQPYITRFTAWLPAKQPGG